MNLFNFSFVDILATTIGVIIFIMVMVILNSSDRISSDDLQDHVEEIKKEIQQQQEAAGEWENKIQEEAERRKEYAQAAEAAAAAASTAHKDLKHQQDRRKKLQRVSQGFIRTAHEMRKQVAALEREAKQAAAQNARRANQDRREVAFRIPRLRQTTKKSVWFECAKGKVYAMALDGTLTKGNFSAVGLGTNAALVTRDDNATGETFKRAQRRGSSFMKHLGKANKNRYYVNFFVRDESYALFRRLRDLVRKRGYEYNWRAYGVGESYVFGIGGGGGSGSVQ